MPKTFQEWYEYFKNPPKRETVVIRDPYLAGKEAAELAQAGHAFAAYCDRPAAPTPPQPTCGDALQDEINSNERLLNLAVGRRDDVKEQMRPLKLAINSGASATARLFLDAKIRDLTPAFEAARAEVDELSEVHRQLLAKRKRRDASCAAG